MRGKPSPEGSPSRVPGDGGAALVVVLSVLLISGVLTLSAVTASKLIFSVAYVAAGRSEAAYAAEGAAARYQWLLMNDIKNHSNRELGADTDSVGEDALGADVERIMADMKPHQMDYYGLKVKVQLDNMIKQIDISGDAAAAIRGAMGSQYEELEDYEDFLEFVDCVKDYTDKDDARGLKGAEEGDYELPNLPRNDRFQYREEMLMVKNAAKFIRPDEEGRLSQFTVIPQWNMPALKKDSNSKTNFFSATNAALVAAGFDPGEVEAILAARQAYFDSGASLADALDPGLYSRLKSKFSFKESEYYTFKIVAGDKVKRTLYLSLRVSGRMDSTGNEYLEWCLY